MEREELSAGSIKRGLRTAAFGRNVISYRTVGSTNEEARRLAARGSPEGTLVIAEEQTAGRGRMGRKWLAPSGSSLLMSLVFRPSLAPNQAQRLTMICSLAICEAITKLTGIEAEIKWPNDILIRGKKVGGILTELGIQREKVEYAIVGIGLNVNLRPDDLPEVSGPITSLSYELGHPVSRLELLQAILESIEARYKRLQKGESPKREWEERLSTLHKYITVTTPVEQVEGWAEEVDEDGTLILRLRDGRRRRIIAGDVTLRPPFEPPLAPGVQGEEN
ncbi:MAG: biotin--[acetyl-CoA-carboxylase] ligase [Anaerolineae bacterium]